MKIILGEINHREVPSASIPSLIKALKDKDYYVKRRAAQLLGIAGAKAKTAVPALTRAIKDQDVKAYATKALEKIRVEK